MNIEQQLAAFYIGKKQSTNIKDANIEVDSDTGHVFCTFNLKLNRKRKDGSYPIKAYKQDITRLIENHNGLENLYISFVTAEMIIAGYFIVPIPNGFLCIGGDEIYSMKDDSCSCPSSINHPDKPCKHLLFRDGLLLQRARINQWKKDNP